MSFEYTAGRVEPIIVFIDWNAFHCTDFSSSVDYDQMHTRTGRIQSVKSRETISMTVTATNYDHFDEIIDTVESIRSPNFVLCIRNDIEYYREDIEQMVVTREMNFHDTKSGESNYEIEIDIA